MENGEQGSLSLPYSSSSNCCISHLFHRTASANPTKIAIIHASKHRGNHVANELNTNNGVLHRLRPPIGHKDRFFTFSELLSAVESLSFRLHHIINGGNDPSLTNVSHNNSEVSTKIVGVYMVPSMEYVIAVLSILRCGIAFLPLDPFWPKERILSIISSSNVNLIIGCLNSGHKKSAHLLDSSHWLLNCPKFPVLCISVDGILEQKCGNLDIIWPCESKDSRLFSYLMYTSGSTGNPKGVCGTEEGILNRFLWMQQLYPLKEDDVMFFKTSISFVDHLQEFLAPMLGGCTLVVPPFNELRENLFRVVDFLCDCYVTRLTAVPSLLRVLLPALIDRYSGEVECSLRLLMLSGEVFPISLWRILVKVFPKTCILNIYGSTEASGDCTYFDCQRLPMMLEHERLSSVPIGMPISNCKVKLIDQSQMCEEGEIIVTGVCLATGYFYGGNVMPLDNIELSGGSGGSKSSKSYYRTGDFARRLPSGDLMFLGRKDRTIKVNGQRIALEEVEDTLRAHRGVSDAAVLLCNEDEEHAFLKAVLVLKDKIELSEILGSIKSWIIDRLPSVMIPREFICTETIPRSSTGKVDYPLMSGLFASVIESDEGQAVQMETLKCIEEAFSKALNIAEVGLDDDFFVLGGDSIMAAHIAYKLGINMRMLYMFPTPSKLQKALAEKDTVLKIDQNIKWETLPKTHKGNSLHSDDPRTPKFVRSRKYIETELSNSLQPSSPKRSKGDDGSYSNLKVVKLGDSFPCESELLFNDCTISRCNRVMYNSNSSKSENLWPEPKQIELPRSIKGSLREIWRVPLESCIDASPLISFKNEGILIFIGSHSYKFLCINARNGSVQWQTRLEGRVECSAVVDGDFAQVVVGCYRGNIYFINIFTGNLNWIFQTGGEVKSQPTVDKCRNLIWCGSYDHNLYGLDYRSHRFVHKFTCGGSIFGSPVIDEIHETLYVGTTNGRLTAMTLKSSEFSTLWSLELVAPIFGSLSIGCNGNIICGLVNGDVLSLNPTGSIFWRVKTDGPIFAGPCISKALASQALVCSRNGNVYSFELETGRILWEYNAGDPITASAFVDENIMLKSDACLNPEKMVCICTSSGRMQLLRVSCITGEDDEMQIYAVKKFAEVDFPGDIFSSPVMIAGQIFVGCRDDYLHCIVAEAMVEETDPADEKPYIVDSIYSDGEQ